MDTANRGVPVKDARRRIFETKYTLLRNSLTPYYGDRVFMKPVNFAVGRLGQFALTYQTRIGMKLSASVFLSALFACMLWGCGDDPAPPAGTPLEILWPNEDGRSWTYDLSTEFWEFDFLDPEYVYDTPAQVPDAPNLGSLFPLIDEPTTPDSTATFETWYRLEFNGDITTRSGVTAQNLVETRGDGHLKGAPDLARGSAMGSGFLATLAAVRPELFPGTQTTGVFDPSSHPSVGLDPLFLHGGAWQRTEDWIGNYGDLDALPSWRFLEGDPLPGSKFTFQLVPQLADDVFLHAVVRAEVNIETPVGTFTNAFDAVYMVDYGISITPDFLGFYREISFGNIVYAPTVGPVKSYERFRVTVGEQLGDGFGHLTLDLIGIQAGDP